MADILTKKQRSIIQLTAIHKITSLAVWLIVDPSKVFVDSENGVAYVADFGFRAVYAVELGSGDRVVMSK